MNLFEVDEWLKWWCVQINVSTHPVFLLCLVGWKYVVEVLSTWTGSSVQNMDVASWNHAMIAGLMMARGQQRNSLLVSSRAHGFFSNVCVQTQAFLLYAVRNTLGRHIMVGEKYLLPTPLWLIPWNVVGQRSVHCIWICQKIVFRPFDPVNNSKTHLRVHYAMYFATWHAMLRLKELQVDNPKILRCKVPCLCLSNSGFLDIGQH